MLQLKTIGWRYGETVVLIMQFVWTVVGNFDKTVINIYNLTFLK